MKNRIILFGLMVVSLTAVLYLCSLNLMITTIYFVLASIISIYDSVFLAKICHNDKLYEEGLNLVQNLLISIDRGVTIENSIKSNMESIEKSRYEKLIMISENDGITTALLDVYPYYYIKIFIDIYDTYKTTGGQFIDLASSFYSYANELSFEIDNTNNNSKSLLLSIFSLWIFSFAIIVISKFALNDYYLKMIENSTFLVLVLISFLAFNVLLSYTLHNLYSRKFIRRLYEN